MDTARNSVGISDLLRVIFGSGGILAISPLRSNIIFFVTRIPYLRLGGMENDMTIEVKGIV